MRASEPGFEVLWNAVLDRARVSFTYRDGSPRTRAVGSYLLQGPLVRDRPRCGSGGNPHVQAIADDRAAKRVSRAGSYEVPADLDLRRLARSLAPREPTETAVLAIRSGRAPALARRGEPASSDVNFQSASRCLVGSAISTRLLRRSPSTRPMLSFWSPLSCGNS